MSLAARLAQQARSPLSAEAADHLRALTLTNLAAATGELGHVSFLLTALPNASPAERAMRLGVRLHARTQDDFFPAGRSHAGAVVTAAVLALADIAGPRFLGCVGAGYAVMCATSRAYAPVAQRRGLRPSGMFGPPAAAAAAAEALELGDEGMAGAIQLAAAMAGGTNQAWISGSDEWVLQAGAAARAGVEAALLVRAGARSAPDALEGAKGWAAAMFDDPGAERLAASLAEPVRVEDVAAKRYPVSGIAQVPTFLACRAHERSGGGDPVRVTVHVSEQEAAYPGSVPAEPPRTRSAALMSIPHCVACGLADGHVSLRRLDRPQGLAALAGRIRVVPSPDLAETEARLTVEYGGEILELSGHGSDVLFPAWDDLRAAPEDLAARSEAPASVVMSIAEELALEHPRAGRLVLEEVAVP